MNKTKQSTLTPRNNRKTSLTGMIAAGGTAFLVLGLTGCGGGGGDGTSDTGIMGPAVQPVIPTPTPQASEPTSISPPPSTTLPSPSPSPTAGPTPTPSPSPSSGAALTITSFTAKSNTSANLSWTALQNQSVPPSQITYTVSYGPYSLFQSNPDTVVVTGVTSAVLPKLWPGQNTAALVTATDMQGNVLGSSSTMFLQMPTAPLTSPPNLIGPLVFHPGSVDTPALSSTVSATVDAHATGYFFITSSASTNANPSFPTLLDVLQSASSIQLQASSATSISFPAAKNAGFAQWAANARLQLTPGTSNTLYFLPQNDNGDIPTTPYVITFTVPAVIYKNGLIWSAPDDGGVVSGRAEGVISAKCNSAAWHGLTNWRLPTLAELESLFASNISSYAAQLDLYSPAEWGMGSYWLTPNTVGQLPELLSSTPATPSINYGYYSLFNFTNPPTVTTTVQDYVCVNSSSTIVNN